MDFSWSDRQLELRDRMARFAEENLNENVVEDDVSGTFSRERWKACADFGVLGLNLPVEYGGQGEDIMTSVLAMEGFGYGCKDNSLPFAINSQIWSVQIAIQKFGTEEQKMKYLLPMCRGDIIGTLGITEMETGSDSYALKMRADKCDGGYVLNGRKCFITSAPISDVSIVFASTNPEYGRWGISAFMVEQGTKGFTATPVRDKMGMRTTLMGDFIFEDCLVPESARLGPEGIGMKMFTTTMESERGYIFSSLIGRMQRQLEEAVAWSQERKAFGKPIGQFQAVSHRLVGMKLRLETARMLLYKVAWLEQTGQPLLMEAALTKLYLSECFVESSMDSVRIHGARGYVTEFEVERDLRDGVGGLIFSGTSDIQRNIIARLLDEDV